MNVEINLYGTMTNFEIDSFRDVPPWKGTASRCPSDVDYYGYTEIEWTPDTGNELLDKLIEESTHLHDEIDCLLIEAMKEEYEAEKLEYDLSRY